MTSLSAPALTSSDRLVRVCGLATLVISIAVLLGWFFGIETLKSVLPVFISMKANTALGFFVLSIVLLVLKFGAPRFVPAHICRQIVFIGTCFVSLLSILTLAEYITSRNFGIDELLIADPAGVTGNFPPGRLAPITAIDFVFVSLSLFVDAIPKRPWHRTSQALALIPFLSSLQVLLGYLVGTTYLFGFSFYTLMALHTALLFVLLSIGIFALRSEDGFVKAFTAPLPSALISRRLLFAAVIIPILTHVVARSGLRAGYLDADFSVLVQMMGSIALVGLLIVASAQALYASENERERARVKAELANRAKVNFLANISHEIRTPLGIVLGFSDLMLSNESEDERKYFAASIQKNGRQLLNMIDDLLEISKIENDHLEISTKRFQFEEFFAQVVSIAQLRCRDAGIELRVMCEGEVPQWIQSDDRRLRQVLLKLVGNAIKFNQPGGVVELRVRLREGKPARLEFSVADNGIGITQDNESSLFQSFAQGDTSLTRRFGGTGIGLAISKHIAEVLGGDLEYLRPASGMGTEFRLRIETGPIESVALVKVDPRRLQGDEPSAKVSTASDDAHAKPLEGRVILLVEDSPENQMLISRYLKSAGAHVETANDGLAGVEKALGGKFDLVLMDLQMPNLDGLQAFKRLRAASYEVPVVAITAHALISDRENSLNLGFREHLTKPVEKTALINAVMNFILPKGL